MAEHRTPAASAAAELAAAQRGRFPALEPYRRTSRAGTDVAWTWWRRVALWLVLLASIGIVALIVSASLRREPPAPDVLHGPYVERFPIIRLEIALVLFTAFLTLWAVYTRLTDTPVLQLVGARPGRAWYRGTVRAVGPAEAWFSVGPVAWAQSSIGARPGWHRTVAATELQLVDGSGAVLLDPGALSFGPNRRAAYQRRHGLTERVLLDGDDVSVFADCTIAADGRLSLAPRLAGPRRNGRRRRDGWLGLMGDGRRFLRIVRLLIGVSGLTAWFMWTSIWLVETWETEQGPTTRSAMVLHTNPVHTVLVASLCALVFAACLGAILLRNHLVALRDQIRASAAVIDVAAQQRHDVITGLLGTLRGAMQHEQTTLAGVALLRADAAERQEITAAQRRASLGTEPSVRRLQQELVTCENRIAAARDFYNDAVTAARTRASVLPNVLLRPVVFPSGVPPLLELELDLMA